MKTYSGVSVTHKNDGIIRQALLPNCILSGCGMSFSGTTLSIATGYLMIAGREIYIDSTTSVTVPTTSTYALVKLTISESTGSVTLSASAASSTSPSVGTQGLINLSGTTYSEMVAIVRISGGAIAGIVKKLRKYAPMGRIYGTAATPSDTDYVDGTEYIQYE